MKDNKGFTLIELIVVIAIIAVLAVVLAPQYIQYVERGRESNDLQIASEIINSTMLALADPEYSPGGGYVVEVVWATADIDDRFRGWLLIRPALGGRVSTLVNPTSGYVVNTFDTEKLAEGIIEFLGVEASPSWTHDQYGVIGMGESALSKEANFAFHVHTSTGEVSLAYTSGDGVKNLWATEFGLDINLAP